ncbi:hypothetical protein [Stenotrophomonas phage YB07]|uniref:Uncharacterized protein n=1 Tax=Stenotrophomonas phage YB07 TaxID=2555548 RepID=A0A482IDR9_9CAUD|nr:hypothetical protein HWC11_gp157 [Stenotrophomonas phage YB07]QBP06353.1 hypothetical protein [Stenotrophomonas phage YB07]
MLVTHLWILLTFIKIIPKRFLPTPSTCPQYLSPHSLPSIRAASPVSISSFRKSGFCPNLAVTTSCIIASFSSWNKGSRIASFIWRLDSPGVQFSMYLSNRRWYSGMKSGVKSISAMMYLDFAHW